MVIKKNDLPVISKNQRVERNDFIEIKYKGYANGELFDSNIEEEAKKINEKSEGYETILVVGQGMIVSGLDEDLEGKDIGKDYVVEFGHEKGFGERKRELVRTIPLKVFTEKQINPKPGMAFNIDDQLVKVVAVSGARVITDFNNPLSGKDLKYEYKIVRKVEDENEKAKALFKNLFRMEPKFEIKEKVIVKGPKGMDVFVKAFSDKFKEFMGKELDFEEVKEEEKKTAQ